MKFKIFIGLIACLLLIGLSGFAQGGDLAATLEVLNGTVEVKRVNTENWIAVNIEAIVGVGDVIRTDATGEARITFFSDGVETDILPNSEFSIDTFSGGVEPTDSFDLEVSVLVGQTVQRLGRVLDASSTYNVNTPGMTLAARGTIFAIRVEDSGRAGMLVSEGMVDAEADEEVSDVPAEFGIRSAVDEALSDVVRASTFDELDSALDGCVVTVSTSDDVRLNVRIAPSTDSFRVGTIGADEIDTFFGVSESNSWYRVPFNGGFGWILSTSSSVDSTCAGLRVFPNDHTEDIENYEAFGEVINPSESGMNSASTTDVEATEEPTDNG